MYSNFMTDLSLIVSTFERVGYSRDRFFNDLIILSFLNDTNIIF